MKDGILPLMKIWIIKNLKKKRKKKQFIFLHDTNDRILREIHLILLNEVYLCHMEDH